MNEQGEKSMQKRREFIETLVRGGMFVSLTVLGGALIGRWREAKGCRQNFACSNCTETNHCRLPEADTYRLDIARSHEAISKDGRTGK